MSTLEETDPELADVLSTVMAALVYTQGHKESPTANVYATDVIRALLMDMDDRDE